jgi:P-type Cu+ transporter
VSVVVVIAAVLLTALLAWYFFAPRAIKRATVDGDLQVQTVTVRGGYSPAVVEVVQGVRTRLLFDRQETGDCSSRVVFPDFKVNQSLPTYATTAVEFVPERVGDFGFACGMNMLQGTVENAPEPGASCTGGVDG